MRQHDAMPHAPSSAVLRPMLTTAASAVEEVPGDGRTWAYEVKWDGVRVLVHAPSERSPGGERFRPRALRLVSRAGNEVTPAYPELTDLADLPPGTVLDGEVVVLRDGRPSFAALAERMHVRDARRARSLAARAPATYIAFDVLRLAGEDVTGHPWTKRRALLEELAVGARDWQLSPVYDDRDALVDATREQGLEGIVAKRRSSRYHPGLRSSDWVKLAHKRVQSTLVGGWRWETGARDRLGSLLVGVPEAAGGLAFAGRVGSGITGAVAVELRRLLEAAPAVDCPFTTEVPAIDARGTIWTVPRIVVDVRYLGRGDAGRLRQPVFRGIRTDLGPDDVRWER